MSTTKYLYTKGENQQSEETAHKMGKNICNLLFCHRINIYNITATQKLNSKITTYFNREFFKEEIQMYIFFKMLNTTSHQRNAHQRLNANSAPLEWVFPKRKSRQCWENGERTHRHNRWKCELTQPLWKAVWTFIKNKTINAFAISYSNTTTVYIPKRHCVRESCTIVFTTTWFATTKIWN